MAADRFPKDGMGKKMAKNKITAKQEEILNYIKAEILDHGYPPAVRDICEAVHLKSTSSVHAHLSALENKGYIRRDPTKPRAIEIIDEEGLDGFNRIENRINSGINVRKTVIATGGSVIYGSEAMHHLKKTGIVVYISLPYEEIVKILAKLLVEKKELNEKELKEFFEENFEE